MPLKDKLRSRSGNRHRLSTLERAFDKHQRLLSGDEVSVEGGKVEIIVSNEVAISSSLTDAQQRESLHQKAQELEALVGDRARVVKATSWAMRYALEDREVSDIYVLGHGSINCLWVEQGKKFDWASVSDASTHLKLGKFAQFTCGHFPLDNGRNVPMGTFAVADFTNVYAALGDHIADEDISDMTFEATLRQVYDNNDPTAVGVQIESFNQRFSDQAIIL